ncbi:hypothetical protein COEREDRAFT_88387 [Coemansia reversa NRRL 1564]|uniref:Letm1 RBD domain-containing protein n=1 Tax=Coemansia reversa (strain ATCC 12441 / NRRL 1564) TaxID=763665 RepID=A0A2G5B764_COERN|nr:hypothetical protein COEREDRAFT_88387 [Coemansia reversa NRRL 1564]|eukprot:PIA14866.1 hypothetical protein COEREDRAFT_88387 [Coemansia reversa NRRL 1564]
MMLARVAWQPLGMRQPMNSLGQTLVVRHGSMLYSAQLHTTALMRSSDKPEESAKTVAMPAARVDPTLPGQSLTLIKKIKAYLGFYKSGAKELWGNMKVVKDIDSRVCAGAVVSRAEFQIHLRNPADRLRLVPFGLLLLFLPEAIPLLVAMLPGMCPSTCITFGTMAKMAAKRDAVRQKLHVAALQRIEEAGLEPSDFDTVDNLARVAGRGSNIFQLDQLDTADLRMVCRFLGIGGVFAGIYVDRLRSGLRRHLDGIATDDALLASEQLVEQLGLTELLRACQERGIPSAHLSEPQLRESLGKWIELTQAHAHTIGMMPIAWSRLALLDRSVESRAR